MSQGAQVSLCHVCSAALFLPFCKRERSNKVSVFSGSTETYFFFFLLETLNTGLMLFYESLYFVFDNVTDETKIILDCQFVVS